MAATKTEYARIGFHQELAYPDTFDKAIDMYTSRTDEVPLVNGQFFSMQDSDQMAWKMTDMGEVLELPPESADGNPIQTTEAAPGYTKEVNCKIYRNAVFISETLRDNDRSGKAMAMLRGLPRSGKRWMEYAMANIINTGETTAGADGSNIFADDHFQSNAQGGVWSNLDTAADLTSTTLETMYTGISTRKNEQGQHRDITLRKVMVTPTGRGNLLRILRSEKIAETATNAKNIYQDLEPIINKYITDADSWFGVADLDESQWGLFMVFNKRPYIKKMNLGAYPHLVAGFEIYFRAAPGAHIVRNLTLNAGN